MSSRHIIVIDDDDDDSSISSSSSQSSSDHDENPSNDTLLGYGEYPIVGIRYYTGVAHPGEFVTLVREPHNPYDANAIRVDNLRGERVGHVKATVAKALAVVMDGRGGGGGGGHVRVEGTIPRRGNAYTLPLTLEFYCTASSDEQARSAAHNLQNTLDSNFHLASRYRSPSSMPTTPSVAVVTKRLDWNAPQAALDKLFEETLKQQYDNLPHIPMPTCCFQNVTPMDYQILGIQWLVKRETNPTPPPFYKRVQENGRHMYLCEITQSSQREPPNPIRGSILCDEMGLGKSLQTIGLILAAPASGVEYNTSCCSKGIEAKTLEGSSKRCTMIVCPVSVLSNWTDQISQFVVPGVLSVELYHGPQRNSILPKVMAGHVDVLLVSYNTLAAEYDAFGTKGVTPTQKKARRQTIFDIDFHRIVLDEAHTIRNSKTRGFKAVSLIRADRKLALTGTPFVNTADDIYSLFSFLGVEPLKDKSIFTRAITQPIKNGDDMGLTRLRTTMGFLSLRRSKQNINMKLVEKDVQLCSVAFANDAHKKVYDALFGTVKVAMTAILEDDTKALKNYSVIFEKLLRLRQACCSGLLLSEERRQIALDVFQEMQSKGSTKKLTAEEGLALLEKLKGTFAQSESDSSLPECGICLMEMDETVGTIIRNCGHVFCNLCIHQVLAKANKKCPYCRAPFRESDIVDMSQAKCAANETGDTKSAEEFQFGMPPKIQALLGAIQRMKRDEKGVIFSQFTSHLDIIGDAMKDSGHTFVRIDGSISAPKRIAAIRSFNSDNPDAPRFILCSLLASGTGINLTRANWCFMMDVWWNEAVESQAMDRIHRISQTRKVNVLRFVMQGSIEERIIKVQERKSLQAKGALQKLQGDEKRKALIGDLRGLLEIKEE